MCSIAFILSIQCKSILYTAHNLDTCSAMILCILYMTTYHIYINVTKFEIEIV